MIHLFQLSFYDADLICMCPSGQVSRYSAWQMYVSFGLQVCYYRDKNSINKFQIAKVTSEGIDICEPFALETNWDLKVRGLRQHTP